MASDAIDRDLTWLQSHKADCKDIYEHEAGEVVRLIFDAGKEGRLPYVLGLFGTWGCGKTTLLASISRRLEQYPKVYKVVYFNSWKYSGLQEVVPSLIYKVLKYGHLREKDFGEIAKNLLCVLGSAYGNSIFTWLKSQLGIDIAPLLKSGKEILHSGDVTSERVLNRYYTQVDQIQDLLSNALGTATDGNPITVVLVDELDRCEPDEAFKTINQIRAFFAMHGTPIVFVLCANPEPIGLTIKHRYGLNSPSSDYEARRILEKFVDGYVDLTEGVTLESLVRLLWKKSSGVPLMQIVDDALTITTDDTVRSATAYGSVESSIPFYANLRVLRKAYDRMRSGGYATSAGDDAFAWTAWHLELAGQVDTAFRKELVSAAGALKRITYDAICGWQNHEGWLRQRVRCAVPKGPKELQADDSSFGFYRGLFWESTRNQVNLLRAQSNNPEQGAILKILEAQLCDPHRMTFLANACLLPPLRNIKIASVVGSKTIGDLLVDDSSWLRDSEDRRWQHLGWLLSNY